MSRAYILDMRTTSQQCLYSTRCHFKSKTTFTTKPNILPTLRHSLCRAAVRILAVVGAPPSQQGNQTAIYTTGVRLPENKYRYRQKE